LDIIDRIATTIENMDNRGMPPMIILMRHGNRADHEVCNEEPSSKCDPSIYLLDGMDSVKTEPPMVRAESTNPDIVTAQREWITRRAEHTNLSEMINVDGNPSIIITSPYKRCIQTADVMRDLFYHDSEFVIEPEFKEAGFQAVRSAGGVETCLANGTLVQHETQDAARKRFIEAFQKAFLIAFEEGANVIIVTHGDAIPSIGEDLLGIIDVYEVKEFAWLAIQVTSADISECPVTWSAGVSAIEFPTKPFNIIPSELGAHEPSTQDDMSMCSPVYAKACTSRDTVFSFLPQCVFCEAVAAEDGDVPMCVTCLPLYGGTRAYMDS
jgi:broad specificity phosphatase PhoE